MIRVLVYDDSQARRDSLETFVLLSPDLQWTGGFENCDNVVDQVELLKPDIVLMDIQMPGIDGLEGVSLIKKFFPAVKVILQTAFDDDEKVFAGIKGGAEGYILKSAGVLQLSQCIDEVMKGGAMMSPSIALKVMRYFDAAHIPSYEPVPDYGISPKELDVLRHLAQGKSYKMVADAMGISYFTVNNHVKKVYQKLQVHSLAEAVVAAQKSRLI